jgi:mono/diheme cytochrome c family protein
VKDGASLSAFAFDIDWSRPMRLLALIGALAILFAIGAAIAFFGGFYSVAENEDDPAFVSWALARVRAASVARQATETPPASLDDPAMVKAGARAYATIGCVNCHGGPPDANWAKWSEGLKPVPADLKVMAKERTPSELFWVIKHGIKMTGMPSFGLAGASDQQIWTIVAFIKNLPAMSDEEYKTWTASP